MWREAAVAAAVVTALTAVPQPAEAGVTDPSTKRVTSGFTSVSACGALTGIVVAWHSTAGTISSVELSSIPAACIGGALSMTLMAASGSALASAGPVTLTGATQTFSVSATASSVGAAAISVVGP